MRRLGVLALMVMPAVCSADWGIDFYRFQCVPQLGRVHIDTFYIPNPDDYGYIGSIGSGKSVFATLAKEHEIYAVEGTGREFQCSLGDNTLRFLFVYGSNSQGQSVGKITIKSGAHTLISNLDLFAYYGYNPLVNRIEIISGGRSPSLFASFGVTGAQGHPNFTFSRQLTVENPITNTAVTDEAKKHP